MRCVRTRIHLGAIRRLALQSLSSARLLGAWSFPDRIPFFAVGRNLSDKRYAATAGVAPIVTANSMLFNHTLATQYPARLQSRF